ncbi:hypothetical protein NIES208_01330 [[Limnothrix rosea] IAM M-220]|nr:hypothetical protein NIES208_01330 [[Limnothrix rosea] IAM M-220]
MLIWFKLTDYFKRKNIDVSRLFFKLGEIHIFMSKNISKKDIEFILPNVAVGMWLWDKLLF